MRADLSAELKCREVSNSSLGFLFLSVGYILIERAGCGVNRVLWAGLRAWHEVQVTTKSIFSIGDWVPCKAE
jgi:hypothetical protein